MIKFKGRLGFHQYLPAKPTKWGIKLWALCEAITGYLSRFQVYTGKEGGRADYRLSFRVVTDLLAHLTHQNLRVYFDNFYTGKELLLFLLARGIYAYRTIRANCRGLPINLLPRNLPNNMRRHDYRVAQNNDLSFTAWKDTKTVLVLSNFHDPTELGHVRRLTGNQRQQEQVVVPSMLADYQLNMKGVDLCDQMIGYYILQHRSNKWWRQIFFYLLTASCHNSFIVAKDIHPDYMSVEYPNFQDFLEEIVNGLLGDEHARRAPPAGAAPPPPPPRGPRVGGRHTNKKLFEKRKVCVVCSARRRPNQRAHATKFGCQECNVAVHQRCEVEHHLIAGN